MGATSLQGDDLFSRLAGYGVEKLDQGRGMEVIASGTVFILLREPICTRHVRDG